MSIDPDHSVPDGWRAKDIHREHALLGGTFSLAQPEEPTTAFGLSDYHEWLQHITMLHSIADGVRHNDPACIEIAVRFMARTNETPRFHT